MMRCEVCFIVIYNLLLARNCCLSIMNMNMKDPKNNKCAYEDLCTTL